MTFGIERNRFNIVVVNRRLFTFLESFQLAWFFLMSNKLRSFLSILGITIGIFCIVGVRSFTGSLEGNIKSDIEKLGDNVIFIQKWPWGFGKKNYEWWQYMKRPEPTLQEMKALQTMGREEILDKVALSMNISGGNLKNGKYYLTGVKMKGVSDDYFNILKKDLVFGRFPSKFEQSLGKNVCVLGYNLAVGLFPDNFNPDKPIRFKGQKLFVIGVLEKEGQSFGSSADDECYIPLKYGRKFANARSKRKRKEIIVKGKNNVAIELVEFEINRIMRSIRRLRPAEKIDYAVNKLTSFSETLSSTFTIINLVAGIIGGFSLLVGGFGIANIMFVSVKERTAIIGIQKALGAKSTFIRGQFLIESIVLTIFGGLLGIALVGALTYAVSAYSDFNVQLTLKTIFEGISISALIGTIFGLIPAISAAKMDPVQAIRSN